MRNRRNIEACEHGIGAAVVAVVLLALTTAAWSAERLPADLASCLEEVERADSALEIEREQLLLEHAETLEGDAGLAARVQRRLAVLDWKYHQRFDEAQTRLHRAAKSGAEPARAWLELARMEQARGNFAAAREAAARAAKTAQKATVRRAAGVAVARASVGEAAEMRRAGQTGVTEPLKEAFENLLGRLVSEPGELEPSRLLLSAAVLLDRGDTALLAWRSYFHVAPGHPAPNAIAGAGEELERILPAWRGADASPNERIKLINALADTRFFTEASWVALDPRTDSAVRENPRVREVLAYAAGLCALREVAEEHYRQTVLGGGDPDEFENEIKAQAVPMLTAMGVDLETPRTDDELAALFDDRFGAYIRLARTGGYMDLHMGHRVVDNTRTVKQYGHEVELRFVALDSMVSNGCQSWAWESGAQHGGWVENDAIWQVRPAYADGAVGAWRRLHSEEAMAEVAETLQRQTNLDDERARENPRAYLPGLALRLEMQGAKNVLQRLERRGLEGDELRLAFLAEYDRAVQESSIFAHEGRHAIDFLIGTKLRPEWKREFYAKLSEVVFTTDPRLALGGIIASNIGNDSYHGQANLHIMKGLMKWMKRHRKEIQGLDRKRPLLPQFDLLSDEQIREAFRSMDPLAA
jgi:hypothetical protein